MSARQGITSRAHPLWLAYILHRLSGLGLGVVLTLPLLGSGFGHDGFDAAGWVLKLTRKHGVVKLAEFGLVFPAGGSHVWRPAVDGIGMAAVDATPQKTLAAGATDRLPS